MRLADAAAEPRRTRSPQGALVRLRLRQSAAEGNLRLNGKTVTVNGLPLIFDHLRQTGLQTRRRLRGQLLETVRIYHAIEPDEETAYREALPRRTRSICQRRVDAGRAGNGA